MNNLLAALAAKTENHAWEKTVTKKERASEF
jgi:hypothetical protein